MKSQAISGRDSGVEVMNPWRSHVVQVESCGEQRPSSLASTCCFLAEQAISWPRSLVVPDSCSIPEEDALLRGPSPSESIVFLAFLYQGSTLRPLAQPLTLSPSLAPKPSRIHVVEFLLFRVCGNLVFDVKGQASNLWAVLDCRPNSKILRINSASKLPSFSNS